MNICNNSSFRKQDKDLFTVRVDTVKTKEQRLFFGIPVTCIVLLVLNY